MSPRVSRAKKSASLQNQTPILNRVITYFENNNWQYTQLEAKSVLKVHFQGESGEWMCYAQVDEGLEKFRFYSVAPVRIPSDRRLAIAEFITRSNYSMAGGNFELDFSDGELRYKTSTEVEKGNLSENIIGRMVYVNVLVMDQYLPLIMAVNYEQLSPEAAFQVFLEQADADNPE